MKTRPKAVITCPVDRQQMKALEQRYDIRYEETPNRRLSLASVSIDEELGGATVLVTEQDNVDAATLDKAPDLNLVVSCRASPVNVDLAECAERGVPVCTTPGRNADSTADLSFALILDVTRRVTEASMWMRSGQWKPSDSGEPYRRFKGPQLTGRTLGVVGGGAVGQRVGQRGLGFGMKVLVYDPFLTQEQLPTGMTLATLDDLLSASDVVTLHVPLMEDTIGLIDKSQISRMKHGAYLVNASRAAVVEESALINGLLSGNLAGAALDVYWDEPPARDSRLFELDNVVVTPHIAGASYDVVRTQTSMVVDIMSAFAMEEELPYKARTDLVDFRKVSPSHTS